MNNGEKLDAIWDFLLILRKKFKAYEPVPFDSKKFAEAVMEERRRCNSFADKFPLYDIFCGKDCPDFRHGMSMAQAAGLIAFLSPDFRRFVIIASENTLRSAKPNTREIKTGVMRLAIRYLKYAHNHPLKSLKTKTAV